MSADLARSVRETAYCGLTCQACPIFWITLPEEETQQQSLREVALNFVNTDWNGNLRLEDLPGCEGCKGGGLLFEHCVECKIKPCAVARGLESCGQCPDYNTCPDLQDFLNIAGPETRVTLDLIAASL